MTNSLNAQWMLGTNSLWSKDPIEVGDNPGPDAWINTYTKNCISNWQNDPDNPMMPNVGPVNHIRMVQVGKAIINSYSVSGPEDISFDCGVNSEFFFKTDIFDGKLILDGIDYNSNHNIYMNFWQDQIKMLQNTEIQADLTANFIQSNGDIASTGVITGNGLVVNGSSVFNGPILMNGEVNSNVVFNNDMELKGKFAIGGGFTPFKKSTYTGGYALSVNGTIVSKKEIVQITSWADKVFDKKYRLMPLTEVEEYIQANKHLPEIPSESEVIDNGVDVGEMNKLLLQKVEELTLYIIQQQKEIDELKKTMKTVLKN